MVAGFALLGVCRRESLKAWTSRAVQARRDHDTRPIGSSGMAVEGGGGVLEGLFLQPHSLTPT